MARFVVSIEAGSVPDSVAFTIKQVDPENVKVINTSRTRKSKRTSGFVLLECSDELAGIIKHRNIPGIKEFETETGFMVIGDLP
ncbi:MAG TPA: hypothetical protein VJC06_01750 [Candidatus Paceibacterota bacterium]